MWDETRPEISVVIPAFNEEESLPALLPLVRSEIAKHGTFEIIVVDDGSADGTLEFLVKAAAADPALRYVSLSRNFGHQAALRAGLAYSSGRCVISMDADMQHPVALLGQMIARWRDGYLVVSTVRIDPPSLPLMKRLTSVAFYKFINALSETHIEPGSADFRLLDRKVVDIINGLSEIDIFMRGLMPWLGFKSIQLAYTPNPRLYGTTKYRWRKMISLAVNGIVSSSTQPLRLATLLAASLASLIVLYMIYALAVYFLRGDVVPGWASVIISVGVVGSLQLLVLGVIGEYVGRVLRENRKRPPFVVAYSNIPELGESRSEPAPALDSGMRLTNKQAFRG
jgi:glycosyltransferase involved in cell wall biosynthesis